MLTVLEGGGQPDDRLAVADLPLGPWAGADVEVWASKTGEVWHGDPDCRQLRSRARGQTHSQPDAGTMTDIRLPDRLHCDPAGALGQYRQAVDTLVKFDAITCDAAAARRKGDLKLKVLDESIHGKNLKCVLEAEPLAPHWSRCLTRRKNIASEIQYDLEDRLPVMLAALWIENGRTPRQHQPRYASFLSVAEDECEQRGISATGGIRLFANDKVLPYWLSHVASGELPRNVTADRAEEERHRAVNRNRDADKEFLDAVRDVWLASGTVWEQRLEGTALGNPGEIFALFHRYNFGLNWELRELFDTMLPHAELETREFNWIAAKVPAIFRLFLTERDRGLVGLVLDEERLHRYDPTTAALFLRNLAVELDVPGLARHVRVGGPGVETADPDEQTPESTLHWQLQGFGTGISDAGITREQCLPALRSAIDGVELKPKTRPQRPRRSRR